MFTSLGPDGLFSQSVVPQQCQNSWEFLRIGNPLDPLNQALWAWGLAICILTSLPNDCGMWEFIIRTSQVDFRGSVNPLV